jgi:hypothetical protein
MTERTNRNTDGGATRRRYFCSLFDRQSNAKKKRKRVLDMGRVRDLPGQLLQRVPPRFITDALDLPGLQS